MKRGLLLKALGLLAFAASAAAFAAAPKASAAAAKRNWAATVTATPEGGFRMGNPNAAVKLVEYGSLTCPHCADFHREAMPELKRDHIASGRVSYEFRNFVLNGPDLVASLVARCQGAPAFFGHVDYFYGQQQQWVAPFGQIGQAERARLAKLPQQQMLVGFAGAGGLEKRLTARGMPAPKVRQCLLNEAETKRLETMRVSADQLGVQGTPTFFVNGVRADAHSWAELKPLLAPPGS
jgi:protein-disulfide isomerase